MATLPPAPELRSFRPRTVTRTLPCASSSGRAVRRRAVPQAAAASADTESARVHIPDVETSAAGSATELLLREAERSAERVVERAARATSQPAAAAAADAPRAATAAASTAWHAAAADDSATSRRRAAPLLDARAAPAHGQAHGIVSPWPSAVRRQPQTPPSPQQPEAAQRPTPTLTLRHAVPPPPSWSSVVSTDVRRAARQLQRVEMALARRQQGRPAAAAASAVVAEPPPPPAASPLVSGAADPVSEAAQAVQAALESERTQFEAERERHKLELSQLVQADDHYAQAATLEVEAVRREHEARVAAATTEVSSAAAVSTLAISAN